MMKIKPLLAGLALAALSCAPAFAQSAGAQLPAGYYWGNPNASGQRAIPASQSAMLDRALGSTRGAIIERGSTGWALIGPSATSGLPFLSAGTGADPAYGVLGIAGGGTNCSAGSGTCLDNISGFSSTGFLTRTGAGSYAFQSTTNGITNANLAQVGASTFKCNPNGVTANVQDCTSSQFGGIGILGLGLADQTISGGANVTTLAQATGNLMVDCGARPTQSITNGGAFTITAPSNDGYCVLLVTNNASAGAITFSGFSVGSNTGDSLTTTSGNKFMIFIYRVGGTSTYAIKALQ